jgi:small subunit ribosomal protein S2
MGNIPNLLFVIDTNKEANAIKEARRLGIPVVAIVDTNCDPDVVDYPIPGNDDASRALELYLSLVSKAAIDGISRSSSSLGRDLGASEEVLEEPALEAETAEQPAEEQAAQA